MRKIANKVLHRHQDEAEHKEDQKVVDHKVYAREHDRKLDSHRELDSHKKLDTHKDDHKELGRKGYDSKDLQHDRKLDSHKELDSHRQLDSHRELDSHKELDRKPALKEHALKSALKQPHTENLKASAPSPVLNKQLERAVLDGRSPVPEKKSDYSKHSFDTESLKSQPHYEGAPVVYFDEDTPIPEVAGVHFRTPIIEETIQPVVIEEVRTIVHRQHLVPEVVTQEQHINEHSVKPIVYKKVVDDGNTRTQTMVGDFENLKIASPAEHAKYVEFFGLAATHNTPHTEVTKQQVQHINLNEQFSQLDELNKKYSHINTQPSSHPHELSKHHSSTSLVGNNKPHSLELNRQQSAPQLHPILAKHTPTEAVNEQGIKKEREQEKEDYFKHNSLDIRAQLCTERLGDLQSQGTAGLPGSFRPANFDRGVDDLERGSRIGLDV